MSETPSMFVQLDPRVELERQRNTQQARSAALHLALRYRQEGHGPLPERGKIDDTPREVIEVAMAFERYLTEGVLPEVV